MNKYNLVILLLFLINSRTFRMKIRDSTLDENYSRQSVIPFQNIDDQVNTSDQSQVDLFSNLIDLLYYPRPYGTSKSITGPR